MTYARPAWKLPAKTHAHPFGGVEVEFVVVTMQDLAPLEDLERMRTEFREHGEPRAAGAAELDQGLDRHRVRRLADRNPMQRRFRVRPFPLFVGAFAVMILGSAAFYVFDHAAAVDAFTRLGFPTWNLGRSRVRESRSLGSVGAKAESLSHPTIPPTPAALHAPNPSPVIGYAMIPPTV